MQSSTAEREKLLSGYSLLLIAALFVIAFVVLLPSEHQFRFGASDKAILDPGAIDDLELAYLRARVAAGEQSRDEVTKAVTQLLDSGHFAKADALLADHPDVKLPEVDRIRLELELAAASFQQADATAELGRDRFAAKLASLLQLLLDKPALHTTELLLRASQLSQLIKQGMLSSSLYRALAVAEATSDQGSSSHWFEQCGVYALASGNKDVASECYRSALRATDNPDRQFSIKVAILRHFAIEYSATEQQGLIDELVLHKQTNAVQLEELSAALLAIERPDEAVDVFIRLAQIDPDNKLRWLDAGAQWALASNQGRRAAELLVEVKPLVSDEEAAQVDQQIENLLIALGEQDRALDQSLDRIEANPDDKVNLRSGIVLAQQLGNFQQAIQWNAQLLTLEPLNVSLLLRQTRLFLALGDLESAREWAERAVNTFPDNRNARVLLAQISEWTGDPYRAVTQWENANRLDANVESLNQLVRLSGMTLQPAVAAAALEQRISLVEPSDSDLEKLIELHELNGERLDAAIAVENVLKRYGPTVARYQLLAELHKRHTDYNRSLATWKQHDQALSRSEESLLNQIELHWRLNQLDEAARLGEQLRGSILPSVTTEYQIRVLSEIAWRYDQPELALLTSARLEQIGIQDENQDIGRRVLQVMQDMGQYNSALVEAERLWADNGQADFALTAMAIRLQRGDRHYPVDYTGTTNKTSTLHELPIYWNQRAAMHVRNNQPIEAEQAYRKTLSLDPQNGDALSGLLWMYIGNGQNEKVRQIIDNHQKLGAAQPQLWSAFAVGYLQIGEVQKSLHWFARLGNRIDADYSTLLLYADALELAQQAEKARQLRHYTLQKLRPMLARESTESHGLLLRQYSRLLSIYGSASEQEQLTRFLLNEGAHSVNSASLSNTDFWKEDIAIAWLMSTERHEHARVLMSRIHQQRLATPVWQQLSLALKGKDHQALQSILELGGPVSAGNRILALRILGQDRRALALAKQLSRSANTISERDIGANQYASIRASRPSYAGSSVKSFSIAGLSVNELGVSARHSLSLSDVGISVDYVQRYLDSSRFDLDRLNQQSDVAVSLHYANGRQGGNVTTGFITTPDSDRVYVDGLYFRSTRDEKHRFTTEVAYNESATSSAVLRIAAKQHRATLGVDSSFGGNEFFRFHLDTSEIRTRVSDKRVARGIQARAEIGFRGSFGSNLWTTSLAADNRSNDREDLLPEELKLTSDTTMDSVLAKKVTSVSIGASLARGDVNAAFPQTSSPRYYLNTRLGHTWPDYTFGLQVDAGAGIRLLGGDELSFGLSHEVLSSKPRAGESDFTSFGVNYRYHF